MLISDGISDVCSSDLWLIATFLDAPDPLEGGAFALFGMRETATSMFFTLAELITPEAGEIGWGEGNVRINHPYLRRVAKLAQTRQLAVGFVHSHPRALPPRPSKVSVVRTFGTGRGVN